MKKLILLTLLLTGCMSKWRSPPPEIENNPPHIPFNVLDADNNGSISIEEYQNQGFGNYSTEEPVITMIVIVLCVVLLTGGLAWIYRSGSSDSDIYDKKE